MGLMGSDDAAGEVFNIGGTEEITILDLAKKIIATAGSESSIDLVPYEQVFDADFEDMQRRVPGIEKINRCIGFAPKTDLDAILDRVISHMRNN